MRFEVQTTIEHDAEKHLARIQAIAAEHALAARAVEVGELLQDEITEGVGEHGSLHRGATFIVCVMCSVSTLTMVTRIKRSTTFSL